MDIIIYILLTILTAYVAIGVFYSLFFAFFSLFYKDKVLPKSSNFAKIAVFLPGYKEDSIIFHVAKDALEQEYPSDKFDVIVIADSFGENALQALRTLPIKLKEVSFEKSTKAKSLNKVMADLPNVYDLAVVLDADNLMKSDFLSKINQAFQQGYMVMQGHRTAKNTDTAFARLDALSEEINNSIFRRGHWQLGISSALIGSAMAFEYKMYKEVMAGIDVVSGFDKELEIQLIKRNIQVAFLNDAIVYDEKVQSSAIFEKQRTRWLAAQINFAIKYFGQGIITLLTKGKITLFDKALQFVLLPRALSLAALLSLIILSYLLSETQFFYNNLILLAVFILAMLMAIPRGFYNWQMLSSIWVLPKAVVNMLLSLLKINSAKNTFIHTPHTHMHKNEKL